MPDGILLDPNGAETTLDETREGGVAVVVFSRGGWCPDCNLTLRAYQAQLLPELERDGVKLIAISPQRPASALEVTESQDLTYPVLSDTGNQIAGKLGIVKRTSEDIRKARSSLGVDVASTNGDGADDLPLPTVVVVGPDGTIRWIEVFANYTSQSEPGDILAAVAEVITSQGTA
jgi:peroxiredoxin